MRLVTYHQSATAEYLLFGMDLLCILALTSPQTAASETLPVVSRRRLGHARNTDRLQMYSKLFSQNDHLCPQMLCSQMLYAQLHASMLRLRMVLIGCNVCNGCTPVLGGGENHRLLCSSQSHESNGTRSRSGERRHGTFPGPL